MKERNQLVDMLKGYACLLVVFGHVIMGIRKSTGGQIPTFAVITENFIWSFHVALFMFLSGFVYHMNGDWKGKGTVGKFIGYKLINLGIPYLVFSSVYILINSVMSSSVNTAFGVADILNLWRTPVAQYWFIYALFWLFVMFAAAGKWLKNWQITLILCVAQIVLSILHVNAGFLGAALGMSFVFGLGASIDYLRLENKQWYVKAGVVVFHGIAVLLLMKSALSSSWLVSQLEACIGIAGSIALISLLSHFKFVRAILLWICQYSFPIYLLHTIFTAGVRIVLFKAGVENYWIHVFLGLGFGILIPYFAAVIANRYKILSFFFYPSKIIRAKKQIG